MAEAGPRKAISRKTRFEVFKRDSFKCQYCGRAAPDVLLQIDHIQPVVEGGSNELLNLVTACAECNGGKGATPLTDSAVVEKQRTQLEQLQERREQLEMMMEWQRGLQSLRDDIVDQIVVFWAERAPGFTPNENGRKSIRLWLRQYSLEEVLRAMGIAADQYLRFTDEGTVTEESWDHAFGKIAGICSVERETKDDPALRELFYIRGIARNRCSYFKSREAMDLLKAAYSWDISLEWLREVALTCRSWTHFTTMICDAIGEARKQEKARQKEEAARREESQPPDPPTK